MIILLGIIGYANTFAVPAQLDDEDVVQLGSGVVHNLFSLREQLGNGRWFVDLTFALNRSLHGSQVAGFHLVNLLLHLAAALTVYLLLQSLITALQRTVPAATADRVAWLRHFLPLAGAALFVSHPIQTQAVTYIVQRYTVLATLCYLGALLSYLRARLAMLASPQQRGVWLWMGASVLLALLAMKCKEIAFTLPLLVVLCELLLFRGELLKSRVVQLLGAALLLVIPLQQLYNRGNSVSGGLLEQLRTVSAETGIISRSDYLLTQLRVVATYLRLLVVPVGQNLDYDYPISHSLTEPLVAAALLLHLILLGGAVLLYRRSQAFQGEDAATGITRRLASLGIFWFYLTLSVESSLIPIRDVINEHRLYLPSLGFFMTVAAVAAYCGLYRDLLRRVVIGMTALLCLTLTVATVQRNRVWGSTITLWQDVLKKSPGKARAHYNLGYYNFLKYRLEVAIPYLVRALELENGMVVCWNTLSTAMSLLPGYEGRVSAGERYHIIDNNSYEYYRGNRSAWWANCYNSLGVAYEYLGNRVRAGEYYRQALLIDPSLDLAWYNSALQAAHRHDPAGAASAVERLKNINPQLGRHADQQLQLRQ
jgi:tetratricopeptide (TPR) repeat protein